MTIAADLQGEPVVPRHVAIVMDGNGRWASSRGKSRNAGHRAGVAAARELVRACAERGLQFLTLFAFSSENWQRPQREVRLLMKLFVEALQREVRDLNKNNVRLKFIGDRSSLNPDLQRQMTESERSTGDNDGLNLIIAMAYGGRWDITQAARMLAREVAAGRLHPDAIDDSRLAGAMSLGSLPDPDLFIRTGGESRVSNFLLWNLAYSELYFSDLYWPDFGPDALDAALAHYAGRQRRFGRTTEQLGSPSC